MNYPSVNPTNSDTLAGAFSHILGKFLQRIDGMLPAKIVNFNRSTNLATVQPLIKIVSTGKFVTSRAQLISVPVIQIGGGGFVLNFPFQKGDFGWIKATDRDISLFLQSWKETPPNTARTHSFSDGVFMPDVMRGWTLTNNTSVFLQNLSGSVKIEMSENEIIFTAPKVTINADLTVTGTITSNIDVISGTISGKTHIHPGDSGGTTGAPL